MNILSLTQSRVSNRDKEIIECIERGLTKFDSKMCQVIFLKFEMDNVLIKEDIVQFPELFRKTLVQIFRFGSTYVERAILNELKIKFKLDGSNQQTLVDAIVELRRK